VQESLPDFIAVLKALNARNVRYVLIGGLAMIALPIAPRTSAIFWNWKRSSNCVKAKQRCDACF
jgi:hypothetical protein